MKLISMALCRLRLLVMCLPCIAATPGLAFDLSPGQGMADLMPHLAYAADPRADLGTMLDRFRAGQFGPELKINTLDTNYAPEAWAAVDITNATLDDGRQPDLFSVTLDLPLVSEVDIYLIRDSGLTESLLAYSIFAPFSADQHSVTRLRSAGFAIAPQERVTLMVNFKFGPFQGFAMALESPGDLETSAFADGIKLTAFYAFSLACMLFFVGFFVALKDWISLLYALLFLIGLAVIAYIDGLLFRFFYPARPEAQSLVGFFLIFALSGSGFLLSWHGFASGGSRRAARVALVLAGVSLFGFLASLISPGTYVAMLSYALLGVMFVAVFLGANAWRRQQGGTYRVAVWLSVVAVAMIVAVVVALATGWQSQALSIVTAIRIIYAIMLIATITNFAAHVLHIRHQHALAVAAQLAALEQEAKRAQELLKAEQNYSRARDLAQLRQRQLATASHDLRQPLASLRMTLDSARDALDPGLRQRLNEAFNYMETLSGDYLTEATQSPDGAPAAPPEPNTEEPYPLSLILQTVWQMFHEEAISKGLTLRAVDSSLMVDVPALVLMRIVSNLVSNAVKYTQQGGVVLGVRRRAGVAEIQVCDTGPGLSDSEIAEFRKEGRKGAQSQGHGLGLAVCFGLAAENGLSLTLESRIGTGTVFALSVPACPASPL